MADGCPFCGHDFDACVCGGMAADGALKNLLGKLPADLYFLTLRQILLNQAELLVHNNRGGHAYEYANDSRKLADRIGEFVENKQRG